MTKLVTVQGRKEWLWAPQHWESRCRDYKATVSTLRTQETPVSPPFETLAPGYYPT